MRTPRRFYLQKPIAALTAFLTFGSGAGVPSDYGPHIPLPVSQPEAARPAADITLTDPLPASNLTAVQERLVEAAEALLGAKSLIVNGRRYSQDCSGTILAIYAKAGIELLNEYLKHDGNGVHRIYRIMETARLLYDTRRPVPGDIVFWDDTYDRNEDGLRNDPLTHAGMVLSVDGTGTVSYVHFHYTKGITVEYMNLETPGIYRIETAGTARIVNSPMRMKSQRGDVSEPWLAGQLYRIFGKGYEYRGAS
jgi:cell wall-associated NlpC family hydrolase